MPAQASVSTGRTTRPRIWTSRRCVDSSSPTPSSRPWKSISRTKPPWPRNGCRFCHRNNLFPHHKNLSLPRHALQYLSHQREHLVGHVSERQVHPRSCGDDGTCVAEGFETLPGMIAPHARIAHTTEGHVLVGNVHNHIVYTASARGCPAEDVPPVGLLAKIIEGQRFFTRIHELHHGFLEVSGTVQLYHREDRAEDFFRHQDENCFDVLK